MTCLGCYGSGRFSGGGGSYSGTLPKTHTFSQQCQRCKGSGNEPQDQIDFVNAINRRVGVA